MQFSKQFITCFILCFYLGFSQQPATSAKILEKAIQQKEVASQNSLVKNVPFENIGPTIMSGRVVDLDVNPNEPTEFYVGYASGGVWHTTNNGSTFEPILDTSNTQNVGDIAVHWKTKTIWVGTGENNSSRSSYAGIGILKSSNNGKTWTNVGLIDAHHFAPILIHPDNPDVVTVGVTGHLYSANNERGIYKTTDGGYHWSSIDLPDSITQIYDIAFQDEMTGYFVGIDTLSDSWPRVLFKTTDGGNTWTDGLGALFVTPKFTDVVIFAPDSRPTATLLSPEELE